MLWTYYTLLDNDRERMWSERANRIYEATLLRFAMWAPELLEAERKDMIAEAAPKSMDSPAMASALAMVAESRARQAAQEEPVDG